MCVEDILKWITGAKSVPPLGFGKKINCQFLHGCPSGCQCRPKTSICDLVFTLPVHMSIEESMTEIMKSAIIDGGDFGKLLYSKEAAWLFIVKLLCLFQVRFC